MLNYNNLKLQSVYANKKANKLALHVLKLIRMYRVFIQLYLFKNDA